MRQNIFSNRFTVRPFVFGLLMSLGAGIGLTSCNNNGSGKASPVGYNGKDSPSGGGAQKVQKAPPTYDPSQWAPGKTSWTWKKRNETGKDSKKSICIQWAVLENTSADGVTIQQTTSGDCQKVATGNPMRFHFFPQTGEIDWMAYANGSPQPPQKKESVFGYLFGNDRAGNFHYSRVLKNPWTSLSIFSPENSKSWYIDAPNSPLHGVLWQNDGLELFSYTP